MQLSQKNDSQQDTKELIPRQVVEQKTDEEKSESKRIPMDAPGSFGQPSVATELETENKAVEGDVRALVSDDSGDVGLNEISSESVARERNPANAWNFFKAPLLRKRERKTGNDDNNIVVDKIVENNERSSPGDAEEKDPAIMSWNDLGCSVPLAQTKPDEKEEAEEKKETGGEKEEVPENGEREEKDVEDDDSIGVGLNEIEPDMRSRGANYANSWNSIGCSSVTFLQAMQRTRNDPQDDAVTTVTGCSAIESVVDPFGSVPKSDKEPEQASAADVADSKNAEEEPQQAETVERDLPTSKEEESNEEGKDLVKEEETSKQEEETSKKEGEESKIVDDKPIKEEKEDENASSTAEQNAPSSEANVSMKEEITSKHEQKTLNKEENTSNKEDEVSTSSPKEKTLKLPPSSLVPDGGHNPSEEGVEMVPFIAKNGQGGLLIVSAGECVMSETPPDMLSSYQPKRTAGGRNFRLRGRGAAKSNRPPTQTPQRLKKATRWALWSSRKAKEQKAKQMADQSTKQTGKASKSVRPKPVLNKQSKSASSSDSSSDMPSSDSRANSQGKSKKEKELLDDAAGADDDTEKGRGGGAAQRNDAQDNEETKESTDPLNEDLEEILDAITKFRIHAAKLGISERDLIEAVSLASKENSR